MMETPDVSRPIFAPVILGTSRQGRASEYAAHFVVDHVAKRPDMRTDLIDIRNIRLSVDDAGEAIMVTIFSDVYFGNVGKLFDPTTGKVTDPAYAGRIDKFLNELFWMARVLRFGRETFVAN
jgi:hypothetical protein